MSDGSLHPIKRNELAATWLFILSSLCLHSVFILSSFCLHSVFILSAWHLDHPGLSLGRDTPGANQWEMGWHMVKTQYFLGGQFHTKIFIFLTWQLKTWGRGWMTKASGVGERRKGRPIFSVSREMSVTMTMMMMMVMMMTMMMMTMMMMVMMMMVMRMLMMMMMMVMMLMMMMVMMMKRMRQMIGMMMRMIRMRRWWWWWSRWRERCQWRWRWRNRWRWRWRWWRWWRWCWWWWWWWGWGGPFAWKITWCPWAAPGILAKARRLQLADASFRDYQ